MKVILPVAGKGERMRPYTNNLPKCLLPVGGKTIIDRIVADTLPLNATETIFITGYKAEAVEEFLKDRPQWGKTRTVIGTITSKNGVNLIPFDNLHGPT